VKAWLTPDNQPGYPVAELVWTPAGEEWESLPIGAYSELRAAYNFEKFGSVTPEEAAAAYQEPGYITAHHWRQVWNAYTQKVKAYYADGLIAYWPLWEALGATRARDLSPNGFYGTPTGATWESAGIGDGMTGVSLSGSGSKIDLAAGLYDAFNSSEGTLLFWAKQSDWNQGGRYLAAFRDSTSHFVSVDHATDGIITWQFKTPAISAVQLSFDMSSLWSGGWHSLAFSWSLSTGLLIAYADGVEVAAGTHPGSWGTSKISQAVLGARNSTPTSSFIGDMAHVALWDRVLTAAEIAHLAIATN